MGVLDPSLINDERMCVVGEGKLNTLVKPYFTQGHRCGNKKPFNDVVARGGPEDVGVQLSDILEI